MSNILSGKAIDENGNLIKWCLEQNKAVTIFIDGVMHSFNGQDITHSDQVIRLISNEVCKVVKFQINNKWYDL